MKVTLAPACAGIGPRHQFLSTYLIDDTVAVDAGSLGLLADLDIQRRVRHVLLTHSHADHIGSLPIFVENVYTGGPVPVAVHGLPHTLEVIRRDVFNDRFSPDFFRIAPPEAPFLTVCELEPGRPFQVAGQRVTAVPVDHIVPTVAFVIEDDSSAVGIVTDTGPTDEVWRVLNRTPNLKAVFLECAFPDHLSWLATVTKHLTPATFAEQAARLARPVPVFAVHVKAYFADQIAAELAALGRANVQLGDSGATYSL